MLSENLVSFKGVLIYGDFSIHLPILGMLVVVFQRYPQASRINIHRFHNQLNVKYAVFISHHSANISALACPMYFSVETAVLVGGAILEAEGWSTMPAGCSEA